ncbi:hypothetical protein FFV02_22985 [Salmonella enterica]|uniref:Uncharacterized protein n=1 Tax=Salmonella typhimurium TaxID=90371 RepID=A0A706Q5Q5_SALTM|nr:hypothetical protein [Salmonella enterica]EGK3392603.1 hypothetical protein [Salmonella enterica subsp. enterica serovar Typhimurium]EIC4202411.1 hypothetical protein [Salmonella enterica subsp. enterica serovar Indiana]EAW4292523.1 hypothetical protein [Salmonella enterica]EAW4306461.1 hypothetical protein [Salmonella enterica]
MKIFGYTLKRNYDTDGDCIRCPDCGSKEFKDTVTATVYEYQPSEVGTHCESCGAYVNFWAYGAFDPCFKFHDKSLPALKDRIIYKMKGLTTP